MSSDAKRTGRNLIHEPLFLVGTGSLLLALALLPLDRWIAGELRVGPTDPLAGLALFVDRMLPRILLSIAALAGLLLWVLGRNPRRRFEGLALALVPLVANRITGVIKVLVGRERPQLGAWPEDGWRALVELADHKSFPSGHVTTAAAFAIVLVWILRDRRWLAALVILLIPLTMWGRMAAFVHYASDTVAGFGVACLTALAFRRIFKGRVWAPPAFWRGPLLLGGWLFITWLWRDPLRPRDIMTWEVLDSLRVVRPLARELLEPFVGPVVDGAADAPLVLLLGAAAIVLFWRTRARAVIGLVVLALAWGGGVLLGLPGAQLVDRVGGRMVEGISADLAWRRGAVEPQAEILARQGVRIAAARDRGRPGRRAGVLVLPVGARRIEDDLWLIRLQGPEPEMQGRLLDEVRLIAGGGGAACLGLDGWDGVPGLLAGEVGLSQLAEAGLTGLLVAFRPHPAPLQADLAALLERARALGLLVLACGDGGGRPGGAVFLPGRVALDEEAVLDQLGRQRPPIAYARATDHTRPGILWMVWGWFVTMGPIARLACLAWFSLFWWAVRRGDRGGRKRAI